ncbi:hypothetical protein BHE74_00050247, partial [Ensete ventricosum]
YGWFGGALQVAVGFPAERIIRTAPLFQQLKLYVDEMNVSAWLAVAACYIHWPDRVSSHDAIVCDVRQRYRRSLVFAVAVVAVELVDDDRCLHL